VNYSIEKVILPSGDVRYELRLWARGRKAPQNKRRFASRKDAQAHVDKLQRVDRDARELGPLEARTFGDEHLFWRQTEALSFAPGWRANLDGYWKELKADLETRKLSQVTDALLSVIETRLVAGGNGPKTVRNKLGFICAVLNYSALKKRIPYSPVGRYQMPAAHAPDIEYWEADFAAAFLTFLNERHPRGSSTRMIYTACVTALNTGVRAGELWALRPRCLRRSQGVVRLHEQLNRVSHEFAQLKGKEARSVPLNAELLCELDCFIEHNRTGLGDLIFKSAGRPVNHDAFHDVFDREVKVWGGPRITFHGLRHTAATLMLASGVDVKTVQEIMGHKDIQTTMKYVHLLGANVKRASETFKILPTDTVRLRLA
jgi:integrase